MRWQYQEKLFIFIPREDEDIRKETWKGDKTNPREVFVRKWKEEKPTEILQCKHLAFAVRFRMFSSKWYIVIKPEWFFSYDGYHKHYLHFDKVTWLKRQERNAHVRNHLRFLVYFLQHQDQPSLFGNDYPYPFLNFGELLSFSDSPSLNDKSWLGREKKEVARMLDSDQLPLLDIKK